MAVRKQRATTSKLYAMDIDYNKVLTEAKKIHRSDNEFYIYNSDNGYHTSISIHDVYLDNYNKSQLEHWKFNKRWIKQ